MIDELLGVECDGELGRDHVGVHVVGLAGLVDRDRGDDGDERGVEQRREHRRVDVHHLTDEPEVRTLLLPGEQQPPSTPESPTAGTSPATNVATTSVLSLPASTIVATSSVSASVTRSPPTNVVSIPSRADSCVTAGPPPCTITGLIPTDAAA